MRFKLLIFVALLLLAGSASATVSQYNLTDGAYSVIIFNGTGTTTWTPPTGLTSIAILVVAGGAGGSGGGGGAGGYNYTASLPITSSPYTIVVGDGGNAPASMGSFEGGSGGNSSFGTLVAIGGGGGSHDPGAGVKGGSGGGGFKAYAGGDADYISPRQGYDGGAGKLATYGWGGGGGGSSEVGATAATNAGKGGNGTSNSITGTAIIYAGGGGGGVDSRGGGGAGTGGTGGGGAGAAGGVAVAGTNGLGGGGGGAGYTAGYGTPAVGGSGVVIIRYLALAPVSSFVFSFTDTSTNGPTSWQWNVTNLLGNNTEVIFSTSQNPTVTLGTGNWRVKLTATNAAGSDESTTQTIGIGLSNPQVYFWNRTS